MPLSTRASSVHEASRNEVSRRVFLRDDATPRREISTRSRDYGGGRTRILIFALAMFRVRPGVNWMLIAVDSWPYIRGTLSPSPPGGPGPQVVYPHVTPLCSATTTTVPPSRATTTPLWDRHPPPPTNTRAAKKRFSPSSTNGFRSLSPSPSARDAWLLFFFFFSSHIFVGTLAALWFYTILSLRYEGHTDRYRRGLPFDVGSCRQDIDRVRVPSQFGRMPRLTQYMKTRLFARNISPESPAWGHDPSAGESVSRYRYIR